MSHYSLTVLLCELTVQAKFPVLLPVQVFRLFLLPLIPFLLHDSWIIDIFIHVYVENFLYLSYRNMIKKGTDTVRSVASVPKVLTICQYSPANHVPHMLLQY